MSHRRFADRQRSKVPVPLAVSFSQALIDGEPNWLRTNPPGQLKVSFLCRRKHPPKSAPECESKLKSESELESESESAHYSFELLARKIIRISVEADGGEIDHATFVSKETCLPNKDEHMWRSANGSAVVTISPDHPWYACPCTYFISVFCQSSCEYTLTVRLEDEPQKLNDLAVPSSQGNGYGVLSALVSSAEARCVVGSQMCTFPRV